MHVTKFVQIAALLAVSAQASSAPASQGSILETRADGEYKRPADLFKFNWKFKLPTWEELQQPADRYKYLDYKRPAPKQPSKTEPKQSAEPAPKKAGRRSLENDEEPEQGEGVMVKRAVAWSA